VRVLQIGPANHQEFACFTNMSFAGINNLLGSNEATTADARVMTSEHSESIPKR
jgi:hypothetical protein